MPRVYRSVVRELRPDGAISFAKGAKLIRHDVSSRLAPPVDVGALAPLLEGVD